LGIKFINGIEIKKHYQDIQEDRGIGVDISKDSMFAFITIEYERKANWDVNLYNTSEIMEALNKMGIIYGINYENLSKCSVYMDVVDMVIAEGIAPLNDKEDYIKNNFNEAKEEALKADEGGRIDYRHVGAVATVNKGEIIACKIIGEIGHDGIDVYGNEIARKKKKKLAIKAGEGCVVKDDTIVEALISGEPSFKGNTYYVYGLHAVNKDVSLATGNIQFIGNVKIYGNVLEGMTVDAGNSLEIEGFVENAKIVAVGDISIKGNIIMSDIAAGGNDIKIAKYINDLETTRNILEDIVKNITNIKSTRSIKSNIADGEMIKLLIETKFKGLIQLCWGIMKHSYEINNGESDELSNLIRSKLIGIAPLQIKNFDELSFIVLKIEDRIEELEALLKVPVNVKLLYTQNSNVYSSGDINIFGIGQYVSDLTAGRGIYFTSDKSVVRGGTIKAKNEIVCKVVGSQGGVKTKIIVEKKGIIKIGFAYQNTSLTVGKFEYEIDKPSYNIIAYINRDKELVVEKLTK
jgi:uncharacterized protein (DUF342 family)